MSAITVNLQPDLKYDLKALSNIRGVSMEDIAYTAMRGYLQQPVSPTKSAYRDKDATQTWFIRLTPDMQRKLEDRAAEEIGKPSSPEGTPGRKTYKATIIRRALRWYISQVSQAERAEMDRRLLWEAQQREVGVA